MPTYQFEAINQAGQSQKGTIEASNSEDAIQRIKAKGYFPKSVREKKTRKKAGAAAPTKAAGKKKKKTEITISFGGVNKKLITQFSRQMSTLQDAGLPILRSLQILAEQQKPGPFKNILEEVAEDVEAGSALSESMAKHPKAFDRLYTKMIAAGEVGGVLDIILQRLAEFMEKAQALKKRIISAMIYPAAVVSIAVLIVTGIMIFVIPKFAEIFQDFDAELPFLTTFLLEVSNWVAGTRPGQWHASPADGPGMMPAGYAVILGSPPLIMFLTNMIKRSKGGRAMMDRAKLRVPIFGRLIKATAIARFTRTLGTLIAAGVPILEAISITRDTVGNNVYERALQKVHDSIREGESFAGPLRETKVCDLLVVNMIDVGEETGELDKMLSKVADNYDEEVDNMVRSMMSLLEPAMVVILGVIVGGIVVALFMPLPALISSVMNAG